MNFFDIQMYLIIKLLWLAFLVIGIFMIYKKTKVVYFLLLVGLVSAVSYGLLVNNLGLLLWGLQGDEVTIAAMYNTFAHSNIFGADFAYHNLAPFYPPAFFWFFGQIGKLMSWNGVVIAKFAVAIFLFSFPLLIYFSQKLILKKYNQFLGNEAVGNFFLFVSPLLILTILSKDVVIGKPYEILAAVLSIFWYLGLYFAHKYDRWTKKTVLYYGVLAGVIFMLYYLWLIFAALAFLILGLFNEQNKLKYFFHLFQTMLVALLVASPFLLPLFLDYYRFGIENWQTALFIPSGLDLWAPYFQISSLANILLLFGLASLIYYRNNKFIKPLLYLFLTTFVWFGIGIISLLFLHKPFQEFRGFYIFAPTILAISAVYGLEKVYINFKIAQHKNLFYVVCILALGYFSTASIFGTFVDDPVIKNQRVESRLIPDKIVNLVSYFELHPEDSAKLSLQTIPQLTAFVPIDNLLYFNQHNNHAAAIFSERYQYVQSLADSKTPAELYEKIQNCPYGKLEQFIFHSPDQTNYYLYFHLDKMIVGTEESVVRFDASLFASEKFVINYQNNNLTLIQVVQD